MTNKNKGCIRFTVRLVPYAKRRLEALSERTGWSQSQIMSTALSHFMDSEERLLDKQEREDELQRP